MPFRSRTLRTVVMEILALPHKKCSFRFLGTARFSCPVFPLKIREIISLLILPRQQFALLVTKNHDTRLIWEDIVWRL
jgi:hypothetical protein